MPRKPPDRISELQQLREYLVDASCDEPAAEIRLVVKLLARLPHARSWLTSLITKNSRPAWMELVIKKNWEAAESPTLKIDPEQARQVAGRPENYDDNDPSFGGLSRPEIIALLRWRGKTSTVISLPERWLIVAVKNARQQGAEPAALVLPLLDLVNRLFEEDRFKAFGTSLSGWNPAEDVGESALLEDDWHFWVFRYLYCHPNQGPYDADQIYQSIPERVRKGGVSNSESEGIRVAAIRDLCSSWNIECLMAPKLPGRPRVSRGIGS